MEKTMKKTLVALIAGLAIMGSAQAQHYHHGHRGGYYAGGGNWIAPLIIGGVVGAVIARESQTAVIVQQPPVVYQQPQVVYQNTGRLVIDMNGGIQCSPGLAPHFIEQVDFRGNTYRQFYACQ
jgi:hypothetical protein